MQFRCACVPGCLPQLTLPGSSAVVDCPTGEGPLFQFVDGLPLTKPRFVAEFQKNQGCRWRRIHGTLPSIRIGVGATKG